MILARIGENFGSGGIALLKTMGAVAAACVLLYVIILSVRVVGGKLERKSYDKYVAKCQTEGTDRIPYETYMERRAKGEKVLWKREDTTQSDGGEQVQPNEVEDQTPSDNEHTLDAETVREADNSASADENESYGETTPSKSKNLD